MSVSDINKNRKRSGEEVRCEEFHGELGSNHVYSAPFKPLDRDGILQFSKPGGSAGFLLFNPDGDAGSPKAKFHVV